MKELRTHLSLDEFRELYERGTSRRGIAWRRCSMATSAARVRRDTGSRTNLVSGQHMYVDDLVTARALALARVRRQLNDYLVEEARDAGCAIVQLDSAIYRRDAHRFYFRERYRS